MIKNLTGITGVTVTGGSTSMPYINMNPNNPLTGMLRINGSDMQVFDGSTWINMGTAYASVGLDQDVLDLVQWARTQRTMSLNRMTLAQNNPALMKALEAVKRAEDNFELLSKFVEHDAENRVEQSP